MKRVWPIVAKDARRLWPMLAFWSLVIVAHFWAERRMEQAIMGGSDWATLFFILKFLIGYVLTAALIFEDSPLGTTSFWMTRPMSGARVFGAKILASGLLFVVLPVLLSLPWLVTGVPSADPMAKFVDVARWHAGITFSAVVIASFTGSFGKFLAGTVGSYLALVGAVVLWHKLGLSPRHPVSSGDGLNRMEAIAAWGVAWIVLGLAVLVQYQTRRHSMALTVLGTGSLIVLVLAAVM